MGSEAGSPAAEALSSKTETLAVHAPLLILSHSGATCICLSFWYSCLWLGFSCGIAVPNPSPSFPAWICQNANHQSGSDSTVHCPAILAPSGQERTHYHTHPRRPSDCWANAGQSLSAGSGLGLNIFRRGPTPIQKLSPSSLGSNWWQFLPSSPAHPPPWGPR